MLVVLLYKLNTKDGLKTCYLTVLLRTNNELHLGFERNSLAAEEKDPRMMVGYAYASCLQGFNLGSMCTCTCSASQIIAQVK